MDSILEELAYAVKLLFEKHHLSSITVASDEEEALHLIYVLEAIFLHGSLSPKFTCEFVKLDPSPQWKLWSALRGLTLQFRWISTPPYCAILERCLFNEIQEHDVAYNSGIPWTSELQANRGISSNLVSFWPFLEGRICEEYMERLHVLRYVDSDVRRCKSWLRMVFNSADWLKVLKELVGNQRALTAYYEDSAFLRNELATSKMFLELRKINELKFQYNFTGLDMMSWSEATLQLSGIICAEDSDSNGDSGGRISPPDSDFPIISKDSVSHLHQLTKEEKRENYQLKEFEKNYKDALKKYSLLTVATKPSNSTCQPKSETVNSVDIKQNSAPLQSDESYMLAKAFEFVVLEAPWETSDSDQDTAPSTTLTAILTKLTHERGLDSQDYKCAGCKKPIGMIFDEAKVCSYTSQYFCSDCHYDEERIIPARVLYNWDFGKYSVAGHSAAFLDSIAFEPLFDLLEINNELYIYVPELREVRDLRIQLYHLKNFILTCREEEVKATFMKKFPSSYIYNHAHMYSLGDLCKVDNGQLCMRLKKGVGRFIQHVKRCELCSVKGFICEFCQHSEVIYPFELDDTYQCKECHSVFHVQCWKKQQVCPRCARISKKSTKLDL